MTRPERRSLPIELRSLGDCAIQVGNKRVDPRAHITFAVLLRLVVDAGTPLSRSGMQSLLWPDVSEVDAGHRLRQTIYELKTIGVHLATNRQNVALVASDLVVDFRDAIANCHRDCGPLCRDFLPGYRPTISSAFELWVETLRDQVHLQIRSALLTSIGIQRSNSCWATMETAARRCLAIDPMNEEATLSLAEAIAMRGNKFEALKLLDGYVADLDSHATKLDLPSKLLKQRISDKSLSARLPTIGRQSEIAGIAALVRETRDGFGTGYLLIGAPGIGKTRIVQEVKQLATLEGVSIATTDCLPSDVEYPLAVITRIISSVLQLPGSLGCSPDSLAYVNRLVENTLDRPRIIGDFDAPKALYSSVKSAIIDLISAVTHEVRLLIVIDDFDQADQWSVAIVADLMAASQSQPLVIVVTARSPEGPLAKLVDANRQLRSHSLRPLSDAEARVLLQTLTTIGPTALTNDLEDLYLEMAGGNPFSIHELARYWRSCGHLTPVPPTIESALRRRADELDADTLYLVQVIALLGNNATTRRIALLLGIPEANVLSQIELLENRGLIRWDLNTPSCTPAKFAELVSSLLCSTASISLHYKMACVLRSELTPTADGRLLWDCANHYRLAGDYHEAIGLLTGCSERLVRIGLPREAVSIWERMLESCRADEERILTYEKLIPVLRALGDFARVSRAANEVTQLREASQSKDTAWTEWHIDVLESRMYSLENVEPILVEASACLADDSSALDTRVRAGICAMICAANLQDPGRLTQTHDQLLSLTPVKFREADRLIMALVYHTELGDLEKGAAAGSDLVALARRTGTPAFLAQSLRRHAHVLRLVGHFGDALATLAEATRLAQWMGSRSYVLRARLHTAQTMFERGDLRAARELLSQIITREDRRSFPYRVIEVAQLRAMLALIEEDDAEAKRVCDTRAFSVWRKRSGQWGGRIGYYSLAVSSLIATPSKMAWRWSQQLATLEREFLRLQSCGEQDFVAFALCKSLLGRGQRGRAQTILADYLGKYRRERYPVPAYLRALVTRELAQPA